MSAVLPDPLARAAALAPERPAVIADEATLSYAELDIAASRAAGALRSLGLQAGDRLGLLAGNVPAAIVAVHAARRARLILVPLHPRASPDELAFTLADAGVGLLLHDGTAAAQATAAVRDSGARALPLDALAELPSAAIEAPSVRLAETQGIVYTSGTSSRPKGVVLTHGSHWWSAVGSALRLGVRDDDRWLLALPFAHVGGLAIVQRAAVAAAPIVLVESFDPHAANAAIAERGVTLVSAVADMLRRMLDAHADRPFPPTLRRVLLGGGPAAGALVADCARRGVPVACTYGLTEAASQVATQAAGAIPGASCGPPLAVTELRIEVAGRSAGAGEEGEIWVRGPTVMAGYHARPQETERTLKGGWLRTGDLGSLDERGELHVAGRCDALIISGGENVSPREIERALLAHPAVAEALVAAAPHERWGAVPVAAVTLRPGTAATSEVLRAHCRTLLAGFKVPERIDVLPELPRGPSGKPRPGALVREEIAREP